MKDSTTSILCMGSLSLDVSFMYERSNRITSRKTPGEMGCSVKYSAGNLRHFLRKATHLRRTSPLRVLSTKLHGLGSIPSIHLRSTLVEVLISGFYPTLSQISRGVQDIAFDDALLSGAGSTWFEIPIIPHESSRMIWMRRFGCAA